MTTDAQGRRSSTPDRHPGGRPGPRPRLRREEILDVALKVLTKEGPQGLSLRRLGDEVGVTARALYGYFDSKEDLESALVSHLIPRPGPVDPSQPWDAQLSTFLLEVHDALVVHPGVARLFVARSTRNPSTDRIREHLLSLLLTGGLQTDHAVAAVGTLSRYLLGCVAIAADRRDEQDPEELPGEEFPILRRIAAQYAGRNSLKSTMYGLHLIIDALVGQGVLDEGVGPPRQGTAGR